MSEGQKNRSQFHTASCIGQVKCEAVRKANSMLGCANRSTARSWREAITALPSAVQITWGRSAEDSVSRARLFTMLHGRRMRDGEIGVVQSRYKENIFHSEDKRTLQQGPRNMVDPPSLEASRPN